MKQIHVITKQTRTMNTMIYTSLLIVGALTLAFISVPSFAQDGRGIIPSTLREVLSNPQSQPDQKNENVTPVQTITPAVTDAEQAPNVSQTTTSQTTPQQPTTQSQNVASSSNEVADQTTQLASTQSVSRTNNGQPISPYTQSDAMKNVSLGTFDNQFIGILVGTLLILIAQSGPVIARFAGAKYQQRLATVR